MLQKLLHMFVGKHSKNVGHSEKGERGDYVVVEPGPS